jgi:hypothetical protein
MRRKAMWKGRWALGFALVALMVGACGGGKEEPAPTGVGETPSAAAAVATVPGQPMTEAATPPVAPTAQVLEGGAMALDAVAGGQVDASRVVTGQGPFEVDVVVVKAGPGYQGYQFTLLWDPAVLAYDSQVDLMPEQLNLCAAPTAREGTVFAGCARVQGNTTFEGPLNTLTFHCVGQGTSAIHLATPNEVPSGSTLLGYGGVTIVTETEDVAVTCSG